MPPTLADPGAVVNALHSAGAIALEVYRTVNLDWTYVSLAAMITPAGMG